MKLYYSTGSCSLAVRIVLEELTIPHESVAVNLKTKQTQSGEDYFKINPKGAVPAISTDEGEVLTENAVIQQYLADTYHGENLLPAAPNFSRYRILELENFITTELHKSCSPFFNPNFPQATKDAISIPYLDKKLQYANELLVNNQYLGGNEFTLADAYLYVILFWLPKIKFDLRNYSEFNRYVEHLNKRPSIISARKKEGIDQ